MVMGLNGTSSVMTFEPLSAPERTGAIVVAIFALFSTLALGFIALRTIRLATVVFLQPNDSTSRPPEILFFRTQLGHYGGCLVLSNMFISIAGLIDFSWVSHSGLSEGSMCLAQVVLRQVGIWSTCWFTAVLGIHTLISLVFRVNPAHWRSLVVVTIGWTISFVAALAPLQKRDVYGPTGSSCGVTRSYPNDILVLEVLPFILAAFVSAAAYSVIFIVLHGRMSLNGTQNLRDPNSNERGVDRFEEYHAFISTIIWTMFWFPLAFVLLLLPFCITHITIFAGQSIPSASSIFADVCVSMLGIVNVCLLCNTFRVINPVYRGRRKDKLAADTVKTFGNDASGESPIVPSSKFFSPSTIWSHEKSPQAHNPIKPSSNHSRDSSWASVDSNTELLCKERITYEFVQTKVTSQASSDITRPSKLSRQLDGEAPFRLTNPERRSLVCPVTRDNRSGPLTRDQLAIYAPGKGAKELNFKSKAPPALNLSPFPDLPHPFLAREVTNKSSTLAAQLDIHVAPPCPPSQATVVFSQQLDQGNAMVSVPPVTVIQVPRIEVATWSAKHADESNSRPSSPTSDSDSEYSGETMQAHKVRPLPRLPELSDDEQDTVDNCPPSSQRTRARSERMTMTSVWSQESGHTLSQPNTEALEMYPRAIVTLLCPGVMLGDKADVGGVMSRPTPSGPRARPKMRRAVKAATRLSARVSEMLSPKSSNNEGFKIVYAPNHNVV